MVGGDSSEGKKRTKYKRMKGGEKYERERKKTMRK